MDKYKNRVWSDLEERMQIDKVFDYRRLFSHHTPEYVKYIESLDIKYKEELIDVYIAYTTWLNKINSTKD